MKLLIDSADPKEIERFIHLGIISGVTTNPTFMQRTGFKSDIEMIKGIQSLFGAFDGNDIELHVEAIGETVTEIVKNAQRIKESIASTTNIIFKIPFSRIGVEACSKLHKGGTPVSLHLVESVNQALIAANAGAEYVCILVGRMEDEGGVDGVSIVDKIIKAFRSCDIQTKVMVSSVRHPIHVSNSFIIGADAITIPPKIFETIFYHPTTERGLRLFWEHYLSSFPISQVGFNKELIVNPEDSLSTALQKTINQKSSAVIIANKGELVGIFTMGDLKRLIASEEYPQPNTPISAIAPNIEPKTILSTDPVSKAKELMLKYNIEQLVVLDGETHHVVGLLQMKDLVLLGVL